MDKDLLHDLQQRNHLYGDESDDYYDNHAFIPLDDEGNVVNTERKYDNIDTVEMALHLKNKLDLIRGGYIYSPEDIQETVEQVLEFYKELQGRDYPRLAELQELLKNKNETTDAG